MQSSLIADQLRRVRKERGWNQRDLADALKVTQPSVSRWENGILPTGEYLPPIAELVGMSVGQLLGTPPGEAAADADIEAPADGIRIEILGAVESGVNRKSFEQPELKRTTVIPRMRRPIKGLFGMLMLDRGMNLAYRRGDILICAPLAELGRLVTNRDHVIAINESDGGIEVVCREANLVFGEWVLDARSSEIRAVTTAIFDGVPPNDGRKYSRVHAVVVGSFNDLT